VRHTEGRRDVLRVDPVEHVRQDALEAPAVLICTWHASHDTYISRLRQAAHLQL
jgi:hypothetical protein